MSGPSFMARRLYCITHTHQSHMQYRSFDLKILLLSLKRVYQILTFCFGVSGRHEMDRQQCLMLPALMVGHLLSFFLIRG